MKNMKHLGNNLNLSVRTIGFLLLLIGGGNLFLLMGVMRDFSYNNSNSVNSSSSNMMAQSVQNEINSNKGQDPFNDYVWSQYCKGKRPCVALLSAAHHGGIKSLIDPRTLARRDPAPSIESDNQRMRILVREGYCAIYGCDVIIDYNDYARNRTMWLSNHGTHKIGAMPPHWNKVAALQRWLPHFDAVVQMDMDQTWVDFNTSVYDLYDSTSTIYHKGSPELIMIKNVEKSHCVVDSWWYYGTSPGCRYFKYPENHRAQTQNLDMPWFWYSLLKCAEIYRAGEPFECLNTCNGPENYVDHMGKDPEHDKNMKLWVFDCYEDNVQEISRYTDMVKQHIFNSKHLNLEMQYVRASLMH